MYAVKHIVILRCVRSNVALATLARASKDGRLHHHPPSFEARHEEWLAPQDDGVLGCR